MTSDGLWIFLVALFVGCAGCFVEGAIGLQYSTRGSAIPGWSPSYHFGAGFEIDQPPHRLRVAAAVAADAGSIRTSQGRETTGIVGVEVGGDGVLLEGGPWQLRASARALVSVTTIGELAGSAGLGIARCDERCGQAVVGLAVTRVEELDQATAGLGPQLRITAPLDAKFFARLLARRD